MQILKSITLKTKAERWFDIQISVWSRVSQSNRPQKRAVSFLFIAQTALKDRKESQV